jgi:hypothetical protein
MDDEFISSENEIKEQPRDGSAYVERYARTESP